MDDIHMLSASCMNSKRILYILTYGGCHNMSRVDTSTGM
ncbi:uncharacterized protein J3R85_011861 [Psidium guajava]|nr:uncharacterized protein J3R85_011861 [Psidium guajava]